MCLSCLPAYEPLQAIHSILRRVPYKTRATPEPIIDCAEGWFNGETWQHHSTEDFVHGFLDSRHRLLKASRNRSSESERT